MDCYYVISRKNTIFLVFFRNIKDLYPKMTYLVIIFNYKPFYDSYMTKSTNNSLKFEKKIKFIGKYGIKIIISVHESWYMIDNP